MKDFRKYFDIALKKNFPGSHDIIMLNTDSHYKIISVDISFVSTSTNPIDKRLDFCAYFLALIKTLDEKAYSYELIRKVCLEVVLDFVKPRSKFHGYLKTIPAKIINTAFAKILLNAFSKRVYRNTHPDGFKALIITDKDETYGFGYGVDIIECGICKLYTKHNYQRYASILCEVDEITSAMAGLKLIRTTTIALGAKKCDFRYEKVGNNKS